MGHGLVKAEAAFRLAVAQARWALGESGAGEARRAAALAETVGARQVQAGAAALLARLAAAAGQAGEADEQARLAARLADQTGAWELQWELAARGAQARAATAPAGAAADWEAVARDILEVQGRLTANGLEAGLLEDETRLALVAGAIDQALTAGRTDAARSLLAAAGWPPLTARFAARLEE